MTEPLDLKEIKVGDLEVFANPSDLRHDLHAFVDYARAHEIKRGYRGNAIPKAHLDRLAKLMNVAPSGGNSGEPEGAAWIAHVDRACLGLGLVGYDTKGAYMGYSSSEPSYPDNYIKVNDRAGKQFIERSLQAQEEAILDLHLKGLGNDSAGANEFFSQGPLTRSDAFDRRGCATGVVPTIPFPKVRRRLLELLARCPSGTWFSTASLVEYLRRNDPWFLIPREIPAAAKADAFSKGRYGNFVERRRGDWQSSKPVSTSDPEGFDKVEGRFVERFLEGLPLVLGYAEVAYLKWKRESEIEPWRGLVPAFRVTEKLRRTMRKEIPAPKVTVLPNFEVHVESLFFPAQVLADLRPFGELTRRGIVTVFRLTKSRIAETLAAQPEQDPAETLQALSGCPLPDNVRQELTAWAGHSEKFVLYEGFGLLEGQREGAGAEHFIVQAISPKFALVRSSKKVYQRLEAAELVPVAIRHPDKGLAAPAGLKTALAPPASPRRAAAKPPLKLKRSVETTLWFGDATAYAAFCKLLLDAKCVLPMNRRALTVSFGAKEESLVAECLKRLGQEYAVAVEEVR